MQLKNPSWRLVFPAFIISLVTSGAISAQAVAPPEAPLTVEEVVRLHQTGFSDDLIITKIKKNGKAFDLSPDELVDLKKEGLNETIIKFLLDPSQPYMPPPPAPLPVRNPDADKKYPPDFLAIRVPTDSGLYVFAGDVPSKVDLKILFGKQESAGLGKMMMKKGRVVAYVMGPAAKMRIRNSKPVLYLRLPEGKEIAEFVLTALLAKNDRREVDVGPGPKPEIKVEAMRPFDSLEVGAKLFKLSPPTLDAGEYLLFIVGSADPGKGTYGKGYDLAIDEPPASKKK